MVKKEKDIRWLLTSVKRDLEKIDIRRRNNCFNFVCEKNIINLKTKRSLGLLVYYLKYIIY